MKRIIEHLRHSRRRIPFRADEIGSPDISDKERVARKDLLRLVRQFIIDDGYRYALRRMTGSFQYSKHNIADLEFIAVLYGEVVKCRLSSCAEDDLGACALGEFAVAAYEVGVKMRFDHIFDFESV